MPTARARHTVTETDDVAAILDTASRVWPEAAVSRAELLRRVIQEGGRRAAELQRSAARTRILALREAAERLSGVYPPQAAAKLKSEWPK
jgi:hypothetical protein